MADPGRHELTSGGEPPAPRGSRTGIALVSLALVAALVAVVLLAVIQPRLSPGVTGRALAADTITGADRTMVVTRIPANGAGRHAHAQEKLIAAIMEDLTTYWIGALDEVTGRPLQALRGGLTAMDSASRVGSAPCVGSPSHIVGNAFYCPPSDGIIYDSAALVPVLVHRYSIGGLVSTFAHEFGHAVQAQARTDTSEPGEPPPDSLLTEAQADCDAGAFLRWVVDGNADHIHMGEGMLMAAIGPIVDFADPVTVDPKDATAHGLAADRLGWLLRGYDEGPASCLQMSEDMLNPILGRIPAGETGDRYPSRRAVLSAAERSIRAFDPQAPTAETNADFVDSLAPIGQFAQATALALEVGARVYDKPGGAACFAGAWVGAVYGAAEPGDLGSRPGDVDEALQAVRHRPGATTTDLAGYLTGFDRGLSGCPEGQ